MLHAYWVSDNVYCKLYQTQYNNICTYSWGVEIDKQARVKHKQKTEAGFFQTTPDFEQVPLTTGKQPKPVCSCLLGAVICLEGFSEVRHFSPFTLCPLSLRFLLSTAYKSEGQ